MEQTPQERFRVKSTNVLAKLAHAEDLMDLLDIKLEKIEQDIENLRNQDDKKTPDAKT